MVTKRGKEWGRDKIGVWDEQILIFSQAAIYKIDNKALLYSTELSSISCDKP